MPEFIYLIHPLRHAYFDRPTDYEEQVMNEHLVYLKRAIKRGMVLLAGPCLDETFDIVVISVEDDKVARDFMLNDPAVKSNVMMAELHPMEITLSCLKDGKC
jgi:uncharacterized protein YciI